MSEWSLAHPVGDEEAYLLESLFNPIHHGEVRLEYGNGGQQLIVNWFDTNPFSSNVFDIKMHSDAVWASSFDKLHQEYERKLDENKSLKQIEQENLLLKEQIAVLNRKVFGTSSEQVAIPETAPDSPGDETPAEPVQKPVEKLKLVVNNRGRKPLPAHLQRESVHYQLPPDKQFCKCCDGKLHKVGEEIVERVSVVPERFKVVRHIQQKYVCHTCNKFHLAETPKALIKGSSYSNEFLANIAVKRFDHGLPYYRQENIFNQARFPFNRTTLAKLMIRSADRMTALYEILKDELRSQDIIHADETVMQVLKEPGRKPQTNSYLWQYRSHAHSQHPVVIFEYQPTRSGEHAKNFLAGDGINGFRGYLCVDGYAGYNKLVNVVRVGCMAHVRRYFEKAIKALPDHVRQSHSHQAIEMIGKLYAVERKLVDQPPKTRQEVRHDESVPILNELKRWLDELFPETLQTNLLGKAVSYAVDQWHAVSRYIEDGRLAIDNNISEREIRAFVIGRKNWLFADSVDGAYANAVMYSLVQTAKANGMNPYDYLNHIFERMPYIKSADEAKSLLPWNVAQEWANSGNQLAA